MERWSLNARGEGRSYLYAEALGDCRSERTAQQRGVGYLMDYEVDSSTTDS